MAVDLYLGHLLEVGLVIPLWKATLFSLFPNHTLWKKVIMHSPYFRMGELRSTFLRVEYNLRNLFGILLPGIFVSSPPFMDFFNKTFRSVWTNGYLFFLLDDNPVNLYVFCCWNCYSLATGSFLSRLPCSFNILLPLCLFLLFCCVFSSHS